MWTKSNDPDVRFSSYAYLPWSKIKWGSGFHKQLSPNSQSLGSGEGLKDFWAWRLRLESPCLACDRWGEGFIIQLLLGATIYATLSGITYLLSCLRLIQSNFSKFGNNCFHPIKVSSKMKRFFRNFGSTIN